MSADKVESSDAITDDIPVAEGFLASIFSEIVNSPLNLLLVTLISILIYKIIKGRFEVPHSHQTQEQPLLPKLRKDFTVQELKPFNGSAPDGRVLVAVNGSVYDVTKGKRFYGPNGPYGAFGGRDASRCLATFSVTTNDKDEYDDLSDLNSMEMDSIREWEMQFKEKYEFVGKLLKPGEQATNYSDEDEDLAVDSKLIEDIDGGGKSEISDLDNSDDSSREQLLRKRVLNADDQK